MRLVGKAFRQEAVMNKNKRKQYGQRPDGSIPMKELPLSEQRLSEVSSVRFGSSFGQ